MIEVTSRRLNAEMSRSALGNTRHRRSQLARRSRWWCGKCLAHWRRDELRTPFLLADANVLRDACTHHRERRQQHPEPPGLSNDASGECDRHNQKRSSHEDVFERSIQRRLVALPSFPMTASDFIHLGGLRLDHLPRQSLWHQADICSAPATKTRAIEVLRGALWTEHLFFAFHLEQTLASCFI